MDDYPDSPLSWVFLWVTFDNGSRRILASKTISGLAQCKKIFMPLDIIANLVNDRDCSDVTY